MSENRKVYGGQAVIEGVGMRGQGHLSLSVRSPEGNIVSEVTKIDGGGHPLKKLPVLRGIFAFWDSLSLGMKMLWRSAEIAMPSEETPESGALLVMLGGIVLAAGLFIALPTLAASVLLKTLPGGLGHNRILVSFTETIIRLLILFSYVKAVSRMQDIQRVLEYHGAEHKVIWAWESCGQGHYDESKEALIKHLVGAGRNQSRLHPRCGTSFLFMVALTGWLLFIFVSPTNILLRIVARLSALPLLAGLSYEGLRASARKDGPFWRALRAPGMMLQSMTTREPDDEQLEVAAHSLALLIEAERGEQI